MANVALKDVSALEQKVVSLVVFGTWRVQPNVPEVIRIWSGERGRTVVTSPDLGKRWGQIWSNTKNVLDGNGSSVIDKCVELYIPTLAPVLEYVRAWFSLNTRIRVVSLLKSMMVYQTEILRDERDMTSSATRT
ncbi:hypothetical protein M0802_012026 [Mischocyttarus mexicanus]|nr:hypothetical protein M0802_012026 [Mischocyttarus mexicanus]